MLNWFRCQTQKHIMTEENCGFVPHEARLINLSGGAEGARAELSRANSSEKYIYIYIYIYRWRCRQCCLATVKNKVWMTSDKGKVARQQQVGRQTGVRFAWAKFAYIGKVLFSVPHQISTAIFINIHWMEISLQNLFPFLQKSFLWKIALKKLHVLWPQ